MTETKSAPEVTEGPDGQPPTGSGMVFVCDASAEAERLMGALRSRGYAAVDVPLGLLPNRVRYETPELVVVDAEAHEATRLIEETIAASPVALRLVLLGQPEGALTRDPALAAFATLVFVRPIDISRTADSLRELLGPAPAPNARPGLARSGRGPMLVASARRPYRTDNSPIVRAGRSDAFESHWPTSALPSLGPLLPDPSIFGELPVPTVRPSHSNAPPPPNSATANLSPETRALLDQARRRVLASPSQLSRPARLAVEPGDHGSVSAELLAALHERLGVSEEVGEDGVTRNGDTAGGPSRNLTRATDVPGSILPRRDESELTNPGGRPPSRGAEEPESDAPGADSDDIRAEAPQPMLTLPPLDDLSDLLAQPVAGRAIIGDPQSLPDGVSGLSEIPSTAPGGRKNDIDTVEPPRSRLALAPPPVIDAATGEDTGRHAGVGVAAAATTAASAASSPSVGSSPSAASSPSAVAAPNAAVTPNPLANAQSARPHPAGPSAPAALIEPPRPATREEPQGAVNVEAGAPMETAASAIRERLSGALAQQTARGVRRALLRDGDILTLTSSDEAESLVQFLVARGDLPPDAATALRGVPRFGRHAGAALVAQGKLRQEDLWTVLRAHAEWLLGLMLSSPESLVLDPNAPQRLLEEPAVFGGAAGAEIYVEVMRRVMHHGAAFERLGSGERALGWGAHRALLAETGLPADLERGVQNALEQPLSRARDKTPQILPVLAALVELDVLTSGGGARPTPRPEVLRDKSAEMDDEAFAASLRARRELVDEGDYFSILGVARSATRYEIDRAREHFRREFDTRNLTGRNAHLVADLELVLHVVDEAHLVLSDDVRRERYRLALDRLPG